MATLRELIPHPNGQHGRTLRTSERMGDGVTHKTSDITSYQGSQRSEYGRPSIVDGQPRRRMSGTPKWMSTSKARSRTLSHTRNGVPIHKARNGVVSTFKPISIKWPKFWRDMEQVYIGMMWDSSEPGWDGLPTAELERRARYCKARYRKAMDRNMQ